MMRGGSDTKKKGFPTMCNLLHATMFHRLVDKAGGVDGAVASITAVTGEEVSRGTVSKAQNGGCHVPITWAWALEDATGDRVFTNFRKQKLDSARSHSSAGHLDAIKEAGEALTAIAVAEENPTPENLAKARKELSDIIEVAQSLSKKYAAAMTLQTVKAAS